jgi:hypothetical protein
MKTFTLSIPVLLLFTAGCLSFFQSGSGSTVADKNERFLPFQESITEDFLYQHLSVIAHDSLKGRETGMPGQKMAAEYLSDFYTDLGLTPIGDDNTFFQHFKLDAEQTDSLVYRTYRIQDSDTLLINHSVAASDTYSEYLQVFGGSRSLRGDIVFAGFGINDAERGVSHLEGIDLQDKWVLVFEEIPYIINGDTLINPNLNNNNRFIEIANRADAKGIIAIGNESSLEFEDLKKLNSYLMTKPRNMRLQYLERGFISRGFPKGYLQVSPEMAAELLELDNISELNRIKEDLIENITEFIPHKLPYFLDYNPYDNDTEVVTENVVAYLEGSDPELKDEVVVLTAHYDHIGITWPDETGDYINNGADDDGSGTVALMAIANALQNASRDGINPRRSILFLHVSAEEVGLLGSRYYSDHPIIPIEQTVVNYNADMIGRSTTERAESGDTDYIFIIGGDIISTQLDSLVHEANRKSVEMELDYSYNDLEDRNQFYRRSDHWNFGRLEVPFVFFFTGVHEDYHSPGDTIDKVDFPKLTRTTRLIFASTIEAANHDQRPEVDNQEFINITRSMPR